MKICVRVLMALFVVVFLMGTAEAGTYKILHKEGSVYDSNDGWLVTTPPYYAGNEWVVDFAYTPDGLVMLHKDGSIWNQTDGWILTTPPYYPGSAYARALEVGELTILGEYNQLTIQPRGATGLAQMGIKVDGSFGLYTTLTMANLTDHMNSDNLVWWVDWTTPEYMIEYDTQFSGDVVVDGNHTVAGSKSFVMPDPTDPTKEIYYACLEGPESGTYVRGTADIVDGTAIITLPDHFAKVTADEGLTVTLTPVGGPLQLYVVEKGTSQIVVGEATGQQGSFDYLVQGVRKGYEDYQVVRDADIERAARQEEFREAIKNR